MIDVPPPQSSAAQDAAHGLLPWLLTVVVGGFGVLWAQIRAKDLKLVGALEARIEEQKKQYDALEASSAATIMKLGTKLDDQRDKFQAELNEEKQARIEDARRTASLLLRGHVNRGRSDRPTEWDEAPTGVRELLELVVPGGGGTIDSRRDPSLPPPRRPPRLPR